MLFRLRLLAAVWLLACTSLEYVLGAAPHNDTSGFSYACGLGNATSLAKLSHHLTAFSPEETFQSTIVHREIIIASANSQVLPLVLNLLKSIRNLAIVPDEGRQLRFLVVLHPSCLCL